MRASKPKITHIGSSYLGLRLELALHWSWDLSSSERRTEVELAGTFMGRTAASYPDLAVADGAEEVAITA